MLIFWENITRYPRFLITSLSGLIIVILSPFLKFAKKNLTSQVILLFFLGSFLGFFSFILNAMLNL